MTGSGGFPLAVPRPLLVLGLVLLFAGLTALVTLTLGSLTRKQRPEEKIRTRLSDYTLTPRPPTATDRNDRPRLLPNSAVVRSTVEWLGRLLQWRGLDTAVSARLEAAGLPLRTGEWVLLHLGSGLLGNLLFVLLGRGQPVAAVLGLLLGLIGPWMFLGLRRDRRQRQFLTQLPDTLQLIAGSLQAGHSLPQAIDAVVRDGAPPISTELQRAVVENQLGLPLVSALDGVATRLSSRDFAWVVMAIRIQGEVGGNLAELLGTVSGTLRERERLRRQVQALSAEGRMSGWILGALPVVFATYLALVRPEYLSPLFTTPAGWAMVGLAVLLLAAGAFWVSRVIKVEV